MAADPIPDHLVILVHGINTRALWMSEVKPSLERMGFAVGQTSFGKFGILRFLAPLGLGRRTAIDRVTRDIRIAREAHRITHGSYPTKMSVISHSFGTYIVSRILLDAPDLEWERIIFCGSVVREDYSIEKVLKSFRHPLLNEIGTKDYLPAFAESAGWGYGSVGSTGFNRPPIETRWHVGFRHSDFLTDAFCTKYWVPFLRGSKPIPADRALALPLPIRLLTLLPLKWAVLACLIAIPASIGWASYATISCKIGQGSWCEEMPVMAISVGATGWIYVGTQVNNAWQVTAQEGGQPPLTLQLDSMPAEGQTYKVKAGVNLRADLPKLRPDGSHATMSDSKGAIAAGGIVKIDSVKSIELVDPTRTWIWAHVTYLGSGSN